MGWDSREDAAFQVARNSIWRRSKEPMNIYPLRLRHLEMLLTRPIEKRDGQLWCPISEAPMSTEFAISRFCVPFLQEKGLALFLDCDVLCHEDIKNLFELADPKYAIQVVKHKFGAGYANTKMDGQVQTSYSRKNWSSVVLWNLDHPAHKRFHVEHLNSWPGRDLHAFKWLEDSEIGELPQKWNWLVNVTPGKPKKEGLWHYTLGGPWFPGKSSDEYDLVWMEENKPNVKAA